MQIISDQSDLLGCWKALTKKWYYKYLSKILTNATRPLKSNNRVNSKFFLLIAECSITKKKYFRKRCGIVPLPKTDSCSSTLETAMPEWFQLLKRSLITMLEMKWFPVLIAANRSGLLQKVRSKLGIIYPKVSPNFLKSFVTTTNN